jgi:hypothetical protein
VNTPREAKFLLTAKPRRADCLLLQRGLSAASANEQTQPSCWAQGRRVGLAGSAPHGRSWAAEVLLSDSLLHARKGRISEQTQSLGDATRIAEKGGSKERTEEKERAAGALDQAACHRDLQPAPLRRACRAPKRSVLVALPHGTAAPKLNLKRNKQEQKCWALRTETHPAQNRVDLY